MLEMLSATLPYLPLEKPNHLLGIADLPSIDQCIPLGIDTFDSSFPTRSARHGVVQTRQGQLNLTKTSYAQEFAPIDPECSCSTCKRYSISYLHHLFKARELPFQTLATIHNLQFMVDLMASYRQKILDDQI